MTDEWTAERRRLSRTDYLGQAGMLVSAAGVALFAALFVDIALSATGVRIPVEVWAAVFVAGSGLLLWYGIIVHTARLRDAGHSPQSLAIMAVLSVLGGALVVGCIFETKWDSYYAGLYSGLALFLILAGIGLWSLYGLVVGLLPTRARRA